MNTKGNLTLSRYTDPSLRHYLGTGNGLSLEVDVSNGCES
jgi:hypothetical protein